MLIIYQNYGKKKKLIISILETGLDLNEKIVYILKTIFKK